MGNTSICGQKVKRALLDVSIELCKPEYSGNLVH